MSGYLVIGQRSVYRGDLSVRGRLGSRVEVGDDSIVEGNIVLERDGAQVKIGDRTFVGGKTYVGSAASVTIGDDVLISFDVLVMDHHGHSLDFNRRSSDVLDWGSGCKDWSNVPSSPVHIGDKVWIGARAIVLSGVSIGEGAVVGCGSVVTKDVAPWTVVAGNPARLVRTQDPPR